MSKIFLSVHWLNWINSWIGLRFHFQLWTECQNNFDDVTVNLEMVYQYSSQAKRSNFKVGWDKKFDFEKITSSYVLIKKLQLFSEIKECTYCYNLNLTGNAASAKSTGVSWFTKPHLVWVFFSYLQVASPQRRTIKLES